MFELTMHFKHDMIGIWQRFQRNFELNGINRVRINRTRPVNLSLNDNPADSSQQKIIKVNFSP